MTPEEEFLKRLKQEKYADPTTDEVFKELFGSEDDKEICIDMLNSVLELQGGQAIKDLTFTNPEKVGYASDDRKAIVDIHAKTAADQNVVIEMQNAQQEFFENRILFYLLHIIMERVPKGGPIPWNYQVDKTYILSFCNFALEQTKGRSNHYLRIVQRMEIIELFVWSDVVTEVYVELPKFKKTKDQLGSRQDLWIYLIKNLPELSADPAAEPDPVIRRFKEKAYLRNFTREKMNLYERARMARWDRENQMAYALKKGVQQGLEQGLEQGIEKGEAKLVKRMHQRGKSIAQIAEDIGATEQEVQHMLASMAE